MTDSTGHGSVEPDPAAEPTNPAAAQAPAFGTPTPGSIGNQGGYGSQTGHGSQGYPPAGYAPAPLSPSEERTWGMLAHLSSFIAGFFGVAFLGPLIVYFMYKDRSGFVRRHASESLNFQISLIIYAIVGTLGGIVISVLTVGLALLVLIPLAIAAAIGAIVLIIMGCVAGNNGREFRYPLTIRLVN